MHIQKMRKKMVKRTIFIAAAMNIAISGNICSGIEIPGQKADKMLVNMIYAAKDAAQVGRSEKEKIEIFVKKMEEHREEYKKAAMEDCLALNGVEKADACSCAVEQTNYPVIFKFLAKHNLTDESTDTAGAIALHEKQAVIRKKCGLPIN